MSSYARRHFRRVGLPFIGFVLTSSYGMMYFQQNRYLFRKVTSVENNEEQLRQSLIESGIVMKPRKTDEEYYEESLSEDIDNWQNIRGPRAYEDNTEWEAQKQQRRQERQQQLLNKMRKGESGSGT